MRTMHFSMNFWSNFTDELGISIERIGDVFTNGISITTIRALVYSGLLLVIQIQMILLMNGLKIKQ